MRKEIPVGVSNLATLLDGATSSCSAVMMQAEVANTDNIKFGYHGHVDFFIQPGKSAVIPTNDSRNIYVSTTGAGNILIFDLIKE